MRSDHPVEAISAYMDGALEPAEKQEMERHLADCGSCRSLLEDLRTLESAQDDPPPVPDGLHRRIVLRLDQANVLPMKPRAPRRAAWRRGMPLAAAASIAAVAVLGVFFFVAPDRISDPGLGDRRQIPESRPSRTPAEVPEAGRDEAPGKSIATEEAQDDRKKGLLSIGGVDSDRGNEAGAKVADESDQSDDITQGAEGAAAAPAPEEQSPRNKMEILEDQPSKPTFAPVPHSLEKESAEEVEPEPEDKNVAPKAARESTAVEGRVARFRQDAAPAIAVEDPHFTITLFRTGAMRIVSGDYQCTVLPEEGATKEITALFESGAGRAGPEQARRIRELLDSSYRDLFSKQCGPLPTALGKKE